MRRIILCSMALALPITPVGCSKRATLTDLGPVAPVQFEALQPEDLGSSFVGLHWTPSTLPEFSAYEIHRSLNPNAILGDTTLVTLITDRRVGAFAVTGLPESQTFTFWLVVRASGGRRGVSNPITARTVPGDVPPPTGIALFQPTDSTAEKITLKWTQNRDRTFSSYCIYVDTLPNLAPDASHLVSCLLVPTDTSFTVTGLLKGRRYHFRVCVTNFAGKTSCSNEVATSTLDVADLTPPDPVFPKLADRSGSSLTLEWSRSTAEDFDHYEVYADVGQILNLSLCKDPTCGKVTLKERITDNSTPLIRATITDLLPDADYTATVLVFDKSGNQSPYANQYYRTRPPVDPFFNWGVFGTGVGQVNSPDGVVIDSNGRVMVSNTGSGRVDVFTDPLGEARDTSVALSLGAGLLLQPRGLAVDADDNIYVCDSGNHRVLKFSPTGELLATIGSFGIATSVDDQPGKFNRPSGVTVDGSGSIWVTDRNNNRIQKFSLSGQFQGAFNKPVSGVLSDPTGIVYSAVLSEILVVDLGRQRVVRFGLDGRARSGDIGQGAGADSGQFNSPNAVATDADGNIYVADTGNDRIQIFRPTGGKPVAIVGLADPSAPRVDYSTGQINLRRPASWYLHGRRAVVVDSGNNVFAFNVDLRSILGSQRGTIPVRRIRKDPILR